MNPAIDNPNQNQSHGPAEAMTLHAGPLLLLFEPNTTFLRRICLNGVEIVRNVYGAVRDRNWGTVVPQIQDLRVEAEMDAFNISFGVLCKEGPIEFFWTARIRGTREGTVRFKFDGEARTSFLRNRIGLCVLHPLTGCAGQSCLVEHADGSFEHGRFPRLISPHQPFQQIRAITHSIAPSLEAEVRFEGEIFEMEDQRNWTDASFKTYGTPLSQPFPVLIEKGTRIRQSVTVGLIGNPTAVVMPAANPWIDVDVPAMPDRDLPPVGLCLASPTRQMSVQMMERLCALSLSHLRVDLHMGQPDWREQLHHAVEVMDGLPKYGLHLALFLTDNARMELESLRDECLPRDSSLVQWHPEKTVSLWLVHHASAHVVPEPLLQTAMDILGPITPKAHWATGTNAHFAELNRNRRNPHASILPCFSITPQVHAGDDRSLFENLEAQPDTVETLREFSDRPIVISPITLRPRFNAVATGADTVASAPTLPASVDSRQVTLQGAAWTLGSLSRLCVLNEIHSLTYYATAGWHGVMEYDEGSPFPEHFPSLPGTVFPIYHVFKQMAGFTRTAPTRISRPADLAALTIFDSQGNRCLLLANLTHSPQKVHIHFRSQVFLAHWQIMDDSNVAHAMREPNLFSTRPAATSHLNDEAFKLVIPTYSLTRVTF